MQIIDLKVKNNLNRYIFQCAMATAAIFMILVFLDVITKAAIITSLGASAFIVFIVPTSYYAKPKPFIGGYIIGIAVGCLFRLVFDLSLLSPIFIDHHLTYILVAALAVGIAIFLMAIFNAEHPPAAGAALGLILNQWDYKTIIFIIGAVVLMSVLRKLLEPKMIDLI